LPPPLAPTDELREARDIARYGWPGLGARIAVRCFTHDPSVGSCLRFLRKTPWARAKVESLFRHSVAHPRKGAAPLE
jgi:uncharacterized protein (DUF2132 family)